MLAVGTPARRGDGLADVSFVMDATRELAAALKDRTVVVTKSTVPIGTGDDVEALIRELRPQARFSVVSNPEFLREGAAIEDFKRPDRIVVGAEDEHARAVMHELYRPLFINETPILFTGRRTAELIKYASNAFLATKITFINEMASLCEKVGANVQDVARGMGLDRRIGSKFLHAGPGFGGSCFPKDTAALTAIAAAHAAPTRIVETVIAVNEARKRAMADKVVAACGGAVRGKKLAILGLTFKPNTDDMREASSRPLMEALWAAGCSVRAYDPVAEEEARKIYGERADLILCKSADEALDGADALAIVTEWREFRSPSFEDIKAKLKSPVIFDGRNLYDPRLLSNLGFTYYAIGRGDSVVVPPHREDRRNAADRRRAR